MWLTINIWKDVINETCCNFGIRFLYRKTNWRALDHKYSKITTCFTVHILSNVNCQSYVTSIMTLSWPTVYIRIFDIFSHWATFLTPGVCYRSAIFQACRICTFKKSSDLVLIAKCKIKWKFWCIREFMILWKIYTNK